MARSSIGGHLSFVKSTTMKSKNRRSLFTELEDALSHLELHPADVSMLVRVGCIYRELSDFKNACRYFERAIAANPDGIWGYLYLGSLELLQGHFVDAKTCFERACELAPDRAIGYWSLGDVYMHSGNPDLAEQHFKEAVAIDPNDRQAKRLLDDGMNIDMHLMSIHDPAAADSTGHGRGQLGMGGTCWSMWTLVMSHHHWPCRSALPTQPSRRTKRRAGARSRSILLVLIRCGLTRVHCVLLLLASLLHGGIQPGSDFATSPRLAALS